jgi:predicted amidophosphoribosyltransferase
MTAERPPCLICGEPTTGATLCPECDTLTRPENAPVLCPDCGAVVRWLERFPKNRCLPCHAKAPETIREAETMTAEKLAGMWGG